MASINTLSSLPTVAPGYITRLIPQEIVEKGVEKEWSYENGCYIYRASASNINKKQKRDLESIIAHYYKSTKK